jgi:hypothetical protein
MSVGVPPEFVVFTLCLFGAVFLSGVEVILLCRGWHRDSD